MAAAGRCTRTRATQRRRRRPRWRPGRRDGAAAGRAPRASRWTRRSGPSTRVGPTSPSGAARRPRDGAATSARTGCLAPYRAGRISSVIPASRTTWRPARSRAWRTRATSQPARATSARPGSIARRVGRRSAGMASRSAGSSRANRSGAGDGSPSGRTGNPPPTSSVSNVSIEPRQRAVTASARRTASRHASTAPSWDPTCRWMPRGRSGPSGPPLASMASAISVSVIPNLDVPAPTANSARVSGATSGLSRYRTSSRRPPPARRTSLASAAASSGDSIATQRSGVPDAAARTAARRSAGVLPMPSSEIRSSAMPARRASVHSPRETTFAPKPRVATALMTAGTSLALTEYCRTHGSGKASRTADAAPSRVARSVTKTGVPNRRAAARRAPSMAGRRS